MNIHGQRTRSRLVVNRGASIPDKMRSLNKKTLKQRFKDWLFDENNDDEFSAVDVEEIYDLDRSTSIRFTVHHANGGRVVQTRRYDDIKDRNIEGLYIITSDQDFGRELDKIITMESMK